MDSPRVHGVLANLPNWLTVARLLATPLLVFLLHDPSPWMVLASVVIFIAAAVTDLLDGYIARRWRVVSDFGSLIDPLADKLLVMTALIMLVALRDDVTGGSWAPAWMVVVILAREIWVTGLRGIAAADGIILAADTLGKWKSLLQMIAIPLLLLHDLTVTMKELVITGRFLGILLLALSLVLSLWSGIAYSVEVFARRGSRRVGPGHKGSLGDG